MRSAALSFMAAVGLFLVARGVAASWVGPDRIPWPASDPQEASVAAEGVATRARWLFRPTEVSRALDLLEAGGVERVAVLERFGGLWILESSADSVAQVESAWAVVGSLRRDESGVPALLRTTALVGAPYAWAAQLLEGDTGSTVAILDSGCDTAHDDLGDLDRDDQDEPPQAAGDADDWRDAALWGFSPETGYRVVGWHDVTDDMPGAVGPYDYNLHGTALASAAFGGGVVDPLLRGVAPKGRFVCVKVYNFEGRWMVWASDLLLGIDWVLNHQDTYRIRAVLVGATWTEDLDIVMAVEALADAGVAVIAPAGNDGQSSMGYPASVPSVIAVGATDPFGLVAAYSTPAPAGSGLLDLVAPGGSDLAADGEVWVCDNEPNDAYRGRVGTSFAAAHVAGAVSLVSEALTESGRTWPSGRAAATWLSDLLTITAAETQGAEVGASHSPRLDRLGPDPIEGHGLLQVPAAVEAVSAVLWPGDRADFTLGAPPARATWARRIPVHGLDNIRVELFPPVEGDFDLVLYRERQGGFDLVGLSASNGLGRSELIELRDAVPGWYLLVVRRARGQGAAVLQTRRSIGGDTRWPLRLSSKADIAPTAYDLDGDGRREIIVVNNVAIDDLAHIFYVFREDGSDFGLFPRTVFSSGSFRGDLTSVAVADMGTGPVLVTGSAFGFVYGVDAQTTLRFATQVAAGTATTSVAVTEAGASSRIFVGTAQGLTLLDRTGAIVATWPVTGGVARAAALGDLDGDGLEEVLFVDGGGTLHARNDDGTDVAGWPVTLGNGSQYSAPVLAGDGSGAPVAVALVETQAGGGARLHAFDASGVMRAGFPRSLSQPAGGSVEALGGVVPSRLTHGGPVKLVVGAIHQSGAAAVDLVVHLVSLDGQEERWPAQRIVAPAYTGGTFRLTRKVLEPPRVVEISHSGEAEVLLTTQLSWREEHVAQLRRFGSTQRSVAFGAQGPLANFEFDREDGHQLDPERGIANLLVVDLDDDHRADLVMGRGTRLYAQTGAVRTNVLDTWSMPRGDARRSACFACEFEPPVSTDPAPAARALAVWAHPNPFNPRSTLSLAAPHAGLASWSIFDARGRLVRSWTQSVAQAGVTRTIFDGLDQRGQRLASGVYRVAVDLEGTTAQTAITLVR